MAVGEVERVETGRILVRKARAIVGTVEDRFEVKRAPGTPPPWVEGERVLLLLAGARSPYRWVEKPVEAESLRLKDEADEARWSEALRALHAVRTAPGARRDLYASWVDSGDAALREVGMRALMDVESMLSAMDEDFAKRRLAVALDEGRAITVRRDAARIAVRHPVGIAGLLGYLGERLEKVDAVLTEIVLEAGLRVRDEQVEGTLSELLRNGSPEQQTLAVRLAVFAQGTEAEQALAELAVGHPKEALRNDAMVALKKLRKNRERRGS